MPRFPGGEVEARGPHPSVIGCGGDLASPERSPPQTHPSTFPASSWPLYSHLTGWLFDLHLRSSVRMDGASQYFVPYLPDLRRRPSVARGVARRSVQRSSWASLSRINRGQLARLLSDVMPVALQIREHMCRSHRLARRAALVTVPWGCHWNAWRGALTTSTWGSGPKSLCNMQLVLRAGAFMHLKIGAKELSA